MSTSRLRVGFVGAGYISSYHWQAVQRLRSAQLVGVCDIDITRAKMLAEIAGARPFSRLDELLDAELDVVHVLTPPATHAEITIQALKRGCHVLVEKPLATSVEDCDRIAATAATESRLVCVNHSLLCDPFVDRALALARDGAVGEILTVDYFRSSEYPAYPGGPLPPQYRDGGYPFRDLGVHALYLLQAFLGSIQDVQAQFGSAGRRSSDPNILFDEWRAIVRCERGTGQVQLSWNVRPLQHVLQIQGTRGVIRADLFGLYVTLKRHTPFPKAVERLTNALGEAAQISRQVLANAWRFSRKRLLPYHGLQTLIANFYTALLNGLPVPVPVERARSIVEWTERVAQPADEAKRKSLLRFPSVLTAPVLVTGANGFIGGALLRRLLAENQRVRIFVRREPAPEIMNDPRVEVAVGDLGDPSAVDRAVAGTRLIYHLGATMRGSRADFERGTVVGTRNIVDSARRHGVGKLVYVSSLSVLHAAAAKEPVAVREDWPLEPHPEWRGAYTQTKLAAERIVAAAEDLPRIILRPGQVFGPGAPLLTPAVAHRLKSRLVILGDGNVVLPLVYVDDVVDAILLAARSKIADGSVFHIVDDGTFTQLDLVARCAPNTPVTCLPLPLVLGLAFAGECLGKLLKRTVPLSRYRVRSALAPLQFDCSAARTRLGWKPAVGVAAGLERTLRV